MRDRFASAAATIPGKRKNMPAGPNRHFADSHSPIQAGELPPFRLCIKCVVIRQKASILLKRARGAR